MSNTDDDYSNPWARMVENVNEAMATSMEQNAEAQSAFVESWADMMGESVPDPDAAEESMAAYADAYEVWMEAADRMAERLADAAAGEAVSATEFRDIWLQSANEAFKEVMDTEAFAAVTGETVQEVMDVQADVEALSQDTLTRMGLPTRDDVDEVGARLVELERRQHDVERTLDRIVELLEAE